MYMHVKITSFWPVIVNNCEPIDTKFGDKKYTCLSPPNYSIK